MRSPKSICLSWSPKYTCPPAPTLMNQLSQKRLVSTFYLSVLYSTFSFVSEVCAKAGQRATAHKAVKKIFLVIFNQLLMICFFILLLALIASEKY